MPGGVKLDPHISVASLRSLLEVHSEVLCRPLENVKDDQPASTDSSREESVRCYDAKTCFLEAGTHLWGKHSAKVSWLVETQVPCYTPTSQMFKKAKLITKPSHLLLNLTQRLKATHFPLFLIN